MADGLLKRVGAFFGIGERPRSPAKTTNEGTSGTPIIAGYIQSSEKNAKLRGTTRYKTFDEYKANVAIIGTGIRNFLTLFEGITWDVIPDPDLPGFDDAGTEDTIKDVKADLATMRTDISRVARKQSLSKIDGFAIQVWTAERKSGGSLGIGRVQVRPPGTIERWVRDPYTNDLLGVFQRDPVTSELIWIERERMIYSVDDQLTDAECGMGLMRHAVTDARVMGVYEHQEGIGYQTDMQGIPIGRAPLGELKALLVNGDIDEDEYNARKAVLESILNNHVKTGNLSVMLDSSVYTDPEGKPSQTYKYDVELIRGDQGSKYDAIDKAIERRELRIARLFGVEHLFIGTSSKGGYSQSADRSRSFGQMVNSTALDVARDLRRDLITPILVLRGYPPDAPIKLMPDATNLRDIATAIDGLWKLAQLEGGGGSILPGDPIVNAARKLLQFPPAPKMTPEQEQSLLQTHGAAPPPAPPVDPNKIDPKTGKPFPTAPKPAAAGARPVQKAMFEGREIQGGGSPTMTRPTNGTAPMAGMDHGTMADQGPTVKVGVFVSGCDQPDLPMDGWINVVEPVED